MIALSAPAIAFLKPCSYNLVDVIEGNCRMKQALIKDKRYPNLCLLPSAQTRDKQ